MKKFILEITVEEEILKGCDLYGKKSTKELIMQEMGWVEASGININKIISIDD